MVHKVEKPKKENLLILYDVINDIFKDKNIDVFYTSDQIVEKKNEGYIFI